MPRKPRLPLPHQLRICVGQTIAVGGLSRLANARHPDRRQKPIVRPTSAHVCHRVVQCYYHLDVQIRAASDRSLLVAFGEEISPQAHRAVRRLTAALEGARGISNLHPAFASVLVEFDPRLHSHAEIESLVRLSLDAP